VTQVDTRQGVLLRGDQAAPPRTLLDILRDTTARHPEASAIEDAKGSLSYRELMARVVQVAARLLAEGVRRGDRVGIRMPSGSSELYISILAVLAAGAAYVPVDVDDPQERADLVFADAGVCGVITTGGTFVSTRNGEGSAEVNGEISAEITAEGGDVNDALFDSQPPHASTHSHPIVAPPRPEDDAWIIFTSGSTGRPKGVAVGHRSAAAFVDAESRLFLREEPLGPGDRVMAGLSVAFDASCEEMWLAWGSGACLVPAPRALVRTGMDLGPWLTARGITVVSTVPTLAALWPQESLENVRLLIFGGEACPPELAERLAVDGREVWNTYGPTEATVVACAALLDGSTPIRIGLPLDGWDLAVVGPDGEPVAEGMVGELIIGGVGLGRYLDPVKDAEKYAPHPQLGWVRAYRSGDLVRNESDGLVFQGRVDDQVKVGGRRIELGEIESALQQLDGVANAAVVVRDTQAGNQVLVGYVALADGAVLNRGLALARLRTELPAALVPLLAEVDRLPTRTSGKVDKSALPWPLPGIDADGEKTGLTVMQSRLSAQWEAVLGLPVTDVNSNFFDLGGGSLAAAQLVSSIRQDDPGFTVADIYSHPRLGAMADELEARLPEIPVVPREYHRVTPTPRRMQILQTILSIPLQMLAGVRWLLYVLVAGTILHEVGGFEVLPTASWWGLIPALLVFATPFGRMAISVVAARMLLAGLRPGDYPRGGNMHLRLWLAEQVAEQVGAVNLSGAPWISYYARALGATIGADVDLHTLPPVTGMLRIGAGAAIEPEVDLAGYWIDGDAVRIGEIRIGANSTIGARSTLLPGTKIGRGAEIAPGSAVFGRVPSGQLWAGSPAQRIGKARAWWPGERPPRKTRWVAAFGVSAVVIAVIPLLSFVAGFVLIAAVIRDSESLAEAALRGLWMLVPATLLSGIVMAGLVVILVRLLGLAVREGTYPVRSRTGWQVWSIERLLDLSRTLLFPIYSSLFTPVWLRMLGAKVGRDVEASTVLLVPSMTTVRDGTFLADDTMIASYELGGGWLRIAAIDIGERAFIGNSGIVPAGHKVPKDGLIAVLSSAPPKSKPGSSWLGSPAVRLRRTVAVSDDSLTFHPPARLRIARTLWELTRIIPVFVTAGIGWGVLVGIVALISLVGIWPTVLLGGCVMLVAGAAAAGVTTIAKWALVGRMKAVEHPLWSSFVWRTEVSDVFVEMVAAPWFANATAGTPALVWWLRSMGTTIGRGVWCETYWLPEPDLATLRDGSTVNRGCVVQTHLFHDRIMSMDTVTLDEGATLGPHSVILPAARIGAHATIGPASLVMRGEVVPQGSRWSGNPIGPWRDVTTRDYHAAANR
jgi:non-ribosomal peptide synthetase-like protein